MSDTDDNGHIWSDDPPLRCTICNRLYLTRNELCLGVGKATADEAYPASPISIANQKHLVRLVMALNRWMLDHGGECPFCGPGLLPADDTSEEHDNDCPLFPLQGFGDKGYLEGNEYMEPQL